ncbi:hypothetical protein CDL12_11928 [Handroanthus impetiginosus]|uniref:S-protein homolog n=1 Tax=Handroanthus impetiginosus TaxID=429701 RepID=A0A2G9HD28_9LAMI|nr:hypothetical protein CDL12_11928 [Handroanthus impetiginosus]
MVDVADDLGNRTLFYLNQEYHWSFCESISHNMLFFYSLSWGSKHLSFDVYKSDFRARSPSRVCSWSVKSDDIYFSIDHPITGMEKVHAWS